MIPALKTIAQWLREIENRTRLTNEPQESKDLDTAVEIIWKAVEELNAIGDSHDRPENDSDARGAILAIAQIIEGKGK